MSPSLRRSSYRLTAAGVFIRRRPIVPAVLVVAALLVGAPARGVPAPDRLAAAVDSYRHRDLASAQNLLEPLAQEDGAEGGRAAYLLGVIDLAQKRYEDA